MARRKRGKNTRIKIVDTDVEFAFSDPKLVEWLRPITHYSDGIKDFSPVFEDFSVYHARSIRRNFDAEGRPNKWTRLLPATIRDRLRQGFGAGPILDRTGALKRGFRFSWGPLSYAVRNIKAYFQWHQEGTEHLPARQMVVLLNQDKQQFTRIARIHLMGRER